VAHGQNPGATLDAALVGHGVSTIGYADALQDGLAAMFVDDVAAGEVVTEYILNGSGGALYTLAGAEYKDAAYLIEVKYFFAGAGRAGRLEIGVTDDQPLPLQAKHPHGVKIGVSSLQTCLQDLDHGASALDVAMGGEFPGIENAFHKRIISFDDVSVWHWRLGI
jgi:hypothetical protein